jgi:hypothetical protein
MKQRKPKSAAAKLGITEPKCIIESIEARKLEIHPYAQKALSLAKVDHLRKHLDLDAIGVLHAVRYEIDGRLATWVVDGHTRLEALMGEGLGEWPVDVEIHLGVDNDARACDLFLKLNDRALVRSYDRFKNLLRAENPAAVGVVEVAKHYGLRIAESSGEGLICSPASAMKIFSQDGGKCLSTTLGVTTRAWGRISAGLESKIIEGISMLVRGYGERLDLSSLTSILSKHPGGPSALLGSARGLRELSKHSLPRCVGEVIVTRYNYHHRAGKLEPLRQA